MQNISIVADELRDLGFPCSVEHPGYIQITRSRDLVLAIGTANETWMIDVHRDQEATPSATIDLRIPRGSQEFAIIADAIQNAIADHSL